MNANLNTPLSSFGISESPSAPFFSLPDKDAFDDFHTSYPPTTDSLIGRGFESAQDSSESTPRSLDFRVDDWFLFNPSPSSFAPPLAKHSMETLLRVIRTWPSMLAKELQTPPILHSSHVCAETRLKPLANCTTITKMWAGQSTGASEIVRQTVLQELRTLLGQVRS